MTLRHRLAEITETVSVHEHPARIAELQPEHGHTISTVESEYPIESYTCGVHAFHLVGDPTYIDIASSGLGKTFAGTDFVNFLLEHQLLSPQLSSASPGDLILYFDGGGFRHVGRVITEARVLSKWGIGWLYEHNVWEVPSNYGDEVRYFVGPDEDASFELFVRFAESKGFQFEERSHV